MATQNHRLPPGSKDSSALGASVQTALEKELKLLIIQDHLKSGGAARAAGRWRELLAENGYAVFQVAGDEPPPEGERLTGKPARGWGRVRELFSRRDRLRTAAVEKQLEQLLSKHQPDLIWMHNLAGGAKWGWAEKMVTLARNHAHVLWTLHDMWALGDSSESYWREDQIVEGGSWKGERAEGLRGLGDEGLRKSRVEKVCREPGKYPVQLAAPSQWLAGLTKKTTGEECAFLPNPIDLEIYSPGNREAARQRLNLPKDGLVVLAGADSLRDRRKGFDLLREAWNRLPRDCATLAMFGRHGEERPGERYLGNLTLDEEMVAAYRAADLYIHPARMENAPCTIQESLSCGTPVVAFAVGGIPEMIEPNKTGFLASGVSAKALQKEWGSALANPARLSEMRERCRKAAEEIWGPDALVKRFLGVVEELRG